MNVVSGDGLPAPEHLMLDVFTDEGRVVTDRRLPERGAVTLPNDLVLKPPDGASGSDGGRTAGRPAPVPSVSTHAVAGSGTHGLTE